MTWTATQILRRGGGDLFDPIISVLSIPSPVLLQEHVPAWSIAEAWAGVIIAQVIAAGPALAVQSAA